jgi:hypothetical protein
VLLCDQDAEHVAAINEHELHIEGPVHQLTGRVERYHRTGYRNGLAVVEMIPDIWQGRHTCKVVNIGGLAARAGTLPVAGVPPGR